MSKNTYVRWTDVEDTEMLLLKAQGKTHAEIGEILGRTKSAIDNRMFAIRRRKVEKAPNMLGEMSIPSAVAIAISAFIFIFLMITLGMVLES